MGLNKPGWESSKRRPGKCHGGRKAASHNQSWLGSRSEGQNIIREARKKADMQAKQILKTQKKANEMIRQAEEIEKKQLQAIVEMKSQIVELMLAAEALEQQLNVYDRMRW